MNKKPIKVKRMPFTPLIDFNDELREYLMDELGLMPRVDEFNDFAYVDYMSKDYVLHIGFAYPGFEKAEDGSERIDESSIKIKITFHESIYAMENNPGQFDEPLEEFEKKITEAKEKARLFISKVKEMEG